MGKKLTKSAQGVHSSTKDKQKKKKPHKNPSENVGRLPRGGKETEGSSNSQQRRATSTKREK